MHQPILGREGTARDDPRECAAVDHRRHRDDADAFPADGEIGGIGRVMPQPCGYLRWFADGHVAGLRVNGHLQRSGRWHVGVERRQDLHGMLDA